ncbi:hypothetical protein ACP70R_050221 [Stipagrostis hirtigluma subsp. patula]
MADRSSRNRRRRRLRAESSSSSSPSSGSSSPSASSSSSSPSSGSSSDRTTHGEKFDPRRRAGDARVLRPMLLGLIRGYYLDAISRLPTAELSSTLARGLLVGGHCYGPLHPVHNIIINSIWYAAAFPFRAGDSIDVSVITRQALSRLAQRSLDGLVASLRYHCPSLSHEDALWHLCLSGADLRGAAASARGAVPSGHTELLQADLFQAAAKEARHPEPAAIALFATSVLPSLERHALSLLAGKRSLSSPDILRLSAMLLPDELPSLPPSPSEKPNPRVMRIIDEKRRLIKSMYQTLLGIADAALRKFARQTGAHYHLHTIYEQSIMVVDEFYLDRYFHIKFMAWPKKNPSCSATKSQASPVRFFAEAHNPPLENCLEEEITLCYMLVHVDNCYACVANNRKIDHPNAEEHCGGRPYKVDGRGDSDFARPIDVDYRFFYPDRDTALMEYYADGIARREAMCSKYRIAEDDSHDDDISNEDSSDEDVSIYCKRYI